MKKSVKGASADHGNGSRYWGRLTARALGRGPRGEGGAGGGAGRAGLCGGVLRMH
jgi:hypothetical protein